nr:PREDICTED: putative invertase inhibitor [Musa acuminata subsp. malaccensis]
MSPAMKPLLYLYLAIFLSAPYAFPAAVQQQTCGSPATVEDACKAVVDTQPAVGYDFCVSSLGAATSLVKPTDLHELAATAAKLAISHATATESKIEELMDLENDATVKSCFNTCLDVYTDATDRLRDALDNLSARLYQKAMAQLDGAMDAADKCEEAFKESKGSFPLASMDKDFSRLASIAHGIIVSIE